MIRKSLVLIAGVSLFALSACDDDSLVPTRLNETPTCEQNDEFCGNTGSLDAGFPPPLDSGVVDSGDEPDSGVEIDSGAADSGVHPDAAAPDAGFPDALPVDTGPPPPPPFLDLSGVHATTYDLDVSDAFLGINAIAEPLDDLNNALNGHVYDALVDDVGPVIAALLSIPLNNIIQSLNIPSWVTDLIAVLDNIANFFDRFKATGEMTLTQTSSTDPNLNDLAGTERWLVLTVNIIDQCPLGLADPTYPSCAEFPITVATPPAMAGPTEVEVTPHPFTGYVEAGIPTAAFQLQNRQVDIAFYQLILLAVDAAVRALTPYNSLYEAITNIVDCVAFGDDVEQAAVNAGVSNIVAALVGNAAEGACDGFFVTIATEITNAIANIVVDWDLLQFDQTGFAEDTNGNGRPELLQTMTTLNTIDGEINTIDSANLGGEWEGFGLNP